MDCIVLKIIESYLDWEKLKEREAYNNLLPCEKDELRLENDNDAKYYHEVMGLSKEQALYADTLVSFWMLYQRLLHCIAGWDAYKTKKSLECLIKQTKATWKNDFTAKIKEVNCHVAEFAQICYTKGNFILLPSRKMNIMRGCRENKIEDRVDLTIYECFGNGKLAEFFKTKDDLICWIKTQNLGSVFINGEICRGNIDWFVEPKPIYEMTAKEICIYLKKAVLLIQKRNK